MNEEKNKWDVNRDVNVARNSSIVEVVMWNKITLNENRRQRDREREKKAPYQSIDLYFIVGFFVYKFDLQYS